MNFNALFRKKSVAQILKQVEKDGAEHGHGHLKKVLSVRDLTALGIAAIIGAGIFSTVGKACFDGGPGVILLFIITAVACGFSALCYADFASRIPVSGSAYTYSYAAFGELVAWIIGWDLIMEYAIGNVTVAISWSGNFNAFLAGYGVHLPDFLCNSFLAVKNGHHAYMEALANHEVIDPASTMVHMQQVWENAPKIGSIPFIVNLPALFITVIITWLVYRGIRESRTSSNLMVLFKLLVIVAVIIIGFFFVQPGNWHPFMPNGFSGVMKGVSAVFFAYIGFDAISTTAEECRNPQRDLPRGMFYSLIICTILYILIALVLTGMVPFSKLNNEAFLASAFGERGLTVLASAIAISAVIATTSVLLVFQLGQPRIWMSMSRDGLLPERFAKIHPKFQTPSFSTIVTGFVVGVPALVLDSDLVTDLCSIGTLFAFILVCGGILLLPRQEKTAGKFRVPYINGQFISPLIFVASVALVLSLNFDNVKDFFLSRKMKESSELVQGLDAAQQNALATKLSYTGTGNGINADTLAARLSALPEHDYKKTIRDMSFDESKVYESGWDVFKHQIPFHIFNVLCVVITFFSFTRKLSLIPVLGLVSCLYLMTELGATNWLRFLIWLIIGLVIYLTYGIKNSKLRRAEQHNQINSKVSI